MKGAVTSKFMHPRKKWKTVHAYGTHHIAYKDRAREAITNALGFEPPLETSLLSELQIRNVLKSIDEGKRDPDTFEDVMKFEKSCVKRLINDYNPELNHLIKDA